MGNENLQEQAYRAIRKKIIYSELEPGTKISEKEIETTIGIGRTPTREALLQLRKEKLLYAIPQSGTYISKINLTSAANARFVREQLEKKIFVEATAKLNNQGIKIIQTILEEQWKAALQENKRDFFHYDNVFHKTCFEIAHREEIWNWLDNNNTHLDRFRWLRLNVLGLKWDEIINQHDALFSAMIKKDTDEVEFLSTLHSHMMLEEKDMVMSTYPHFFTKDSLNADL